MTWQMLAYLAVLTAATVGLTFYSGLIARERDAMQVERDGYRDLALSRNVQVYEWRCKAGDARTETERLARQHADLAGRYMELRALADGAIGEGVYPPHPDAWRELREATLTGEPSPMFGNVRPLRPFGA